MVLKSKKEQSPSPKIVSFVQYSSTKLLTQGLSGCLFLFLYNLYNFVREVLCISTNYDGVFGMKNYFNNFIFLLFNEELVLHLNQNWKSSKMVISVTIIVFIIFYFSV
jgi:hypothetical protein